MKKLLFILGLLVIGFGIQVNAQNTQSAFFDGSHARIRVADASPVNPNAIPSAYQISGTAITVEAWIFPMDLPTGTDSRYIIARPANTGFGVDPYQTFALFIYGNAPFSHQPRIGISISDGTHPVGTGYEVFVEDTAAVKIGQWTHVAGTYDGTNVKLYINSILVHHLPLNVTMGSGSTGLYIGGVAGGYFKGIIDEVRLWNTTRTQEEIQASMNETLAGTESGLNGYWPMDSVYTTSSGILATIDKTPNHNDLAVQYDAKLVPFPQGSTVHIAPTYVRSSNDHALIGELFTEKLYSNGWPVPSISVTQKPSGMIIAGDSLFWTPQENQFGSFAVVATTSNSSGAIVDTVYVFSEAIRSAQNQVCVDVTHRGKMGAWGLYGKGIFYKSKNGLYAGDFSLVDRNNAKFAGGLYSKSTSFNPIEGFTTVSSRFPGFTAFKTSFADEWETNRIGVRVFQTVNSSTTTGDDKYAVIEYQVVNESGAPIGDLFAQLSADFDIGTAENNLGKYDSLLQMTYSYESGGANNSYFYGFSLLNQTVSGEAVFINGTDPLYIRSTSNLTTKTPNPTTPGDYRNQISTGPFNITQGETLTVAFAVFAGDDLNDIKNSAARAKQVYNSGETVAQIPNFGFENWTTQGGIEIPSDPWVTNNLQPKPSGVTYNPVTKSSDHYPVNVGSYSIRLENNISFISEPEEPLPYYACSYGYTATAFYPGYTGPTFPITGHPNSLCGYYKFLPQNNDTMSMSVVLYHNGAIVSSAFLNDTNTTSTWSSFCIPIPNYTIADSAQVGFSAFYAGLGPELPTGPYGNSILYIDNLSFDALITTSINREHGIIPEKFKLGQNYPNPFNPTTTICYSLSEEASITLDIYDLSGKVVRTLMNTQQVAGFKSIVWDGCNNAGQILSSGVYIYRLTANNFIDTKKMVFMK